MREPLRDKERLEHMLAAAERVIRYTSGKSFENLKADDMMYWKQVRGMRNYIVHEYFQIDDVVVWGVVTEDIPVLRQQIIDYLDELNKV